MLLTATELSKSHGMRALFRGVCLSIDEGDRVGIIGPNGAGKSTLLRLLAQQEVPDAGSVLTARGLVSVYVPQRDEFPEGQCARDAATDAARGSARCHGDVHEAAVLAGIVLGKFGFDEERMNAPLETLSGGWRKRCSIATGIAQAGGAPDLLLLDEPTNHLDVDGLEWLERFLVRGAQDIRAKTSICITHDRVFLERVATRVGELSRAYPGGIFMADGGVDEFARRKSEFLEAQSKQHASLANEVRVDNAWLGRGAQARRTKAKGRIEESAARRAELAKLAERNAAAGSGGARVDFSGSGRRTRRLLWGQGVSAVRGGRLLFRDVELELTPGDCIAVMGANGSGKTTLLRTLIGECPPDTGTVGRADPAPRVVMLSQQRAEIDPALSLKEVLCPVGTKVRFRDGEMHITAWSRRFLFDDDQLLQQVSTLSGGELARVHIARMMLEPADVLVLDEPTNDLDLPTLELLEQSIEDFAGPVLLVTHDRAMLERLATQVIVLGGPQGQVAQVTDLAQALRAHKQFDAAAEAAARASRALSTAPVGAVAVQQATVPGVTTEAAASVAPGRKKLSYKDQREYDGIEGTIAAAEATAIAVDARLNDPELIADHVAYAKACGAAGAAHRVVSALYLRWEELEAKLR
ncbi:MAG: ABC-F family ATP-binding cassette domain-containing protein [Planctomycetota bacterium]|nr:ABC-F family ATP-binding cassette domain-containing protein [Planctomycetota bacterium]MDA1106718.1 ABC-F family ATP-binding cassette domain-containing protein [Planctomycetota bacterium]